MTALDEIKERLDIVDLISQRVTLKKSGKTFRGSCPFHADRSPSFYVYPDDWSYHCFGCQAHGSGIDFVMQMEKLDFGEALRALADRAGVTLPDRRADAAADRERQRQIELQTAATQYFQHLLLNATAAEPARAYLASRGINQTTIETFQLGYSLPAWEETSRYLQSRGFSLEEIAKGGLVVERESGGYYDRFRNRIMFPITGRNGEVLGFGARALLDEDHPKYLNSPETPLFEKSRILYGLDRAAAAIRAEERAVVVEGYVDVLIAHQFGIKNVVGVMGTALSERQVRSLKRLTKRIVLALDADASGEGAVLRDLEQASTAFGTEVVPVPTWRGMIRYEHALDTDIRVAVLPAGRDPDEVIREDPQRWRQIIDESEPLLDYLFRVVLANTDHSDPKGKSEAANRLLRAIGEVPDRVVQAHYIQRLAVALGVNSKTLWPGLFANRRPGRQQRRPVASAAPPALPTISSAEDVLESYILALMIRFPQLSDVINSAIGSGDFAIPGHGEIFRLIQSGGSVDVRAELDESLHERYDRLASYSPLPKSEDEAKQELDTCLRSFKLKSLRRTIDRLGNAVEAARSGGDLALSQELAEQEVRYRQQLHELMQHDTLQRARPGQRSGTQYRGDRA